MYLFLNKIDFPWFNVDDNFPALSYLNHFIAFNGRIILITMLNHGLSEFPLEILNFKNLNYLCLSSNKIRELHKSIIKLENLETLYLDDNQFTKIPDSIIIYPN
jgi:Leucine-rich repeat (LRR) protein